MRDDIVTFLIYPVSVCATMNDKHCVFPFKSKGKSYSSCTKDGYHTYWCSTSNKKDGSYKEWDICGDSKACGKGKIY